MPGGIGLIDEQVSKACRNGKQLRQISAGAGEAEIFYNLDSGRAHYDAASCCLYFMHSPYAPVEDILSEIFHGRTAPAVEQVVLDRHGMFNAGRRVELGLESIKPVLVALRVAGLRVTVAGLI